MNTRFCKWLVSFAIIFCLIIFTTTVTAGKPDKCPDHPSCKDQTDPMALPFLVAILPHVPGVVGDYLYHPGDFDVVPGTPCLAQAHDHMTNFNIVFLLDDRGCATLTTDQDTKVLPTLGFNVVRDKKSGNIVSAWFQGVDPESIAYISGEMVTDELTPVPEGACFRIHLDAEVRLAPCDNGFKNNSVCDFDNHAGWFAIEDLLYCPNPDAGSGP